MAVDYTNRYYAGWTSLNGKKGYVYIDQLEYSGSATELTLRDESIEVTPQFNDWEDPVLGFTASFSIHNDGANFYDLLPLMTAAEREYRVRIVVTSPSAYTVFQGFINCEPTNQKMLLKQDIQIVASSYLSKMEFLEPPSISTLQHLHFINLIDEILCQTGAEYNIRVNCSLYSRDGVLTSTQTLFNINKFFTELYWDDNVKRKTSLSILRSILSSFHCYLYWFDGYWWIERYEDIWCDDSALEQSFVEYQTGQEYGVYDESSILDEGTLVTVQKTLTDLHSFTFKDTSQTIKVNPGYKTVEIRLDEKKYLNQLNPDLTNSEDTIMDPPYPNIRTWENWSDALLNKFWYKGTPWHFIRNAIYGANLNLDADDLHKGVYTRFNVTNTVDSDDGTVLNISFKSGINLAAWSPTKDNTTFTYYWYLRSTPGNYYIMQEDSDGSWHLNQVATGAINAIQSIEVSGSSFKRIGNSNWIYTDVNIEVPLWEVEGLSEGDLSLVLAIGLVKMNSGATTRYVWDYFGDFQVTITEPEMNNDIIGVANTNFLNKKELSLDLFDVSSLNYKNGVFYGDDRTVDWTDDGVVYDSLVDKLMKSKFKLYNTTRQQIVATIETTNRLRPLQMFYDSKQSDKPFLLMGYTYNLVRDEYIVDLREYDKTTEITLT